MKKNLITAYVYAEIDYLLNQIGYRVATMILNKREKVSVFNVELGLELGLWDGVPGSGICWAQGAYESLDALVKEIVKGVEEYKFRDFNFSFDYPDYLSVSFFKPKDSKQPFKAEDILSRERPLNEQERESFARAFIALSNKTEEK